MSPVREPVRSRLDVPMMAAVGLLVALGTLAILSAASPLPYFGGIVKRHFIALALGLAAFVVGSGLNYQLYQDQAKTLYALAIAVLVGVLLFGQVQRGTKGWLHLGLFSIQPSELARILTILALAAFLDRYHQKVRLFRVFAGALLLAGPVIVLILKQPDLSSVLVLFPVVLAMLFCAGTDLGHLGVVLGFGAVASSMPILWTLLSLKEGWLEESRLAAFLHAIPKLGAEYWLTLAGIALFFAASAWLLSRARFVVSWAAPTAAALIVALGLTAGVAVDHQLKGYQRKRIEAFLEPSVDPRGSSYNLLQAQIALGSGGLWGRGVFSGTQSQLGFLPERHTDFIFAVVGEEMGLLGSLGVIGLYLWMIWRIVEAARSARDRFGYLVACGFAAMLSFYLLFNTGMCLGFFPVAGLQLPLVSYGGSNLVATLWALGIVQSIYSRRYAFY